MRPHLYKRPCPSVRPSVGPLVRWCLMLLSKSMKNGLLRILNDLDSAGRGKKRGEEGGTRGRRDEESEKMKKLLKNEKWKSR